MARQDLFTYDANLDVETYNYIRARFQDAAFNAGSAAKPDRRLDYIFVDEAVTVLGAGPWRGRLYTLEEPRQQQQFEPHHDGDQDRDGQAAPRSQDCGAAGRRHHPQLWFGGGRAMGGGESPAGPVLYDRNDEVAVEGRQAKYPAHFEQSLAPFGAEDSSLKLLGGADGHGPARIVSPADRLFGQAGEHGTGRRADPARPIRSAAPGPMAAARPVAPDLIYRNAHPSVRSIASHAPFPGWVVPTTAGIDPTASSIAQPWPDGSRICVAFGARELDLVGHGCGIVAFLTYLRLLWSISSNADRIRAGTKATPRTARAPPVSKVGDLDSQPTNH